MIFFGTFWNRAMNVGWDKTVWHVIARPEKKPKDVVKQEVINKSGDGHSGKQWKPQRPGDKTRK